MGIPGIDNAKYERTAAEIDRLSAKLESSGRLFTSLQQQQREAEYALDEAELAEEALVGEVQEDLEEQMAFLATGRVRGKRAKNGGLDKALGIEEPEAERALWDGMRREAKAERLRDAQEAAVRGDHPVPDGFWSLKEEFGSKPTGHADALLSNGGEVTAKQALRALDRDIDEREEGEAAVLAYENEGMQRAAEQGERVLEAMGQEVARRDRVRAAQGFQRVAADLGEASKRHGKRWQSLMGWHQQRAAEASVVMGRGKDELQGAYLVQAADAARRAGVSLGDWMLAEAGRMGWRG